MNRNDRIESTTRGWEEKTPSKGALLLQFALIGSGRVSNTTEEMQTAARGVFEEVIDAARRTGCPIGSATEASPFSTEAAYALFDWLDAVCAAAGAEVVEEIFHRPKPRHLQ